MDWNSVGIVVQSLTLPVLVATVWATWRQAKAAQQTVQIAMEQFEVARNQLHASFRPALDVKGNYGISCAHFTLRNIGAGPALNIEAQYISGVPVPLGNLETGATVEFLFDNSLNRRQTLLGMGKPDTILQPVQDTPLRFDFYSTTGAHCWTKVAFPVGRSSDGMVEVKTEQGINTLASSGANANGLRNQ